VIVDAAHDGGLPPDPLVVAVAKHQILMVQELVESVVVIAGPDHLQALLTALVGRTPIR